MNVAQNSIVAKGPEGLLKTSKGPWWVTSRPATAKVGRALGTPSKILPSFTEPSGNLARAIPSLVGVYRPGRLPTTRGD